MTDHDEGPLAWTNDPDRAAHMATVTGNHDPDDLDQTAHDIHQAHQAIEAGEPPHPATITSEVRRMLARPTRGPQPMPVTVLVEPGVVAKICASRPGAIADHTTAAAIHHTVAAYITELLTQPIEPELGPWIQRLAQLQHAQPDDSPEVRT